MKCTVFKNNNKQTKQKQEYLTYSQEKKVKRNHPEEIPRWRLEVGSRKRDSYSEILERRWRHFAGIITEKRHNCDPSTSPAGAESPLHVKRRTEEAPGPPVTGAHTAWEDADQVSFAVPRFPHRQAWARAA
jgi:hypothetical protein